MGILSRMKMYMKVDGATGEVVAPPAYIGWIEIAGLAWPGEPPYSNNADAIKGSTPDAKGVLPDYPDFPSKTVKDRDVEVRSFPGSKHSPRLFLMAQQATPTNVDIWVPMPHNKLLKARLTNVFVNIATSAATGPDRIPTELITFHADSGKLRAAP
jgi:hypothetical protein